MPNSVLLLGATDVTLAVAEAVLESGAHLAGIATIGETFKISYSATPVRNARSVDVLGWGQRNNVEIIQFIDYDRLLAQLNTSQVDICLVAGWFHMVPERFRTAFRRGCYGFHASLLPTLRGGAPLNWAILTSQSETGVTLFQMNDGVDEGLIFGQAAFAIAPRATIGELVDEARKTCAMLTRDLVPALLAGTASGWEQSGAPSYGLQRSPEDGRIDWRNSGISIDRLVRAVGRPYPGAFTSLEGEVVQIWATEPLDTAPEVFGAPGQIVRLPECCHPCVMTGDGLLQILDATSAQGDNCIDKLRKSGHKRFTF